MTQNIKNNAKFKNDAKYKDNAKYKNYEKYKNDAKNTVVPTWVSMARAPDAAFTTSGSSSSPQSRTQYFTLSFRPSHLRT